MRQKPFSEILIGETFESYGRTVTETDVVAFASLAGLKLPIFIDAEFCRTQTEFGQRIVPGLLIQAFAAGMMEELLGPLTIAALGFGESRFLEPTVIGDTLRCRSSVASKRVTKSGKGRGVIEIAVEMINQRREVVMQSTYRLLMRVDDAAAA